VPCPLREFSLPDQPVSDFPSKPKSPPIIITYLTPDSRYSRTTIAPSLGPILGGVLSYAAGWAWIFWFLTIVTGLSLLGIIFLLPETSRNIVGNGSIPPAAHLRLPIPIMRHWEDYSDRGEGEPARHGGRMPNPLQSLKILLRMDNAVVVLAYGLMYALYTCVIASLSTLCIEIYGLNQWQAGLVYLPFGLGGTVSTFFSGSVLDSAYRRARARRGLSADKVKGDDLDSFPVEKSRLSVMWLPMAVAGLSVVAYGWVLHHKQVWTSIQISWKRLTTCSISRCPCHFNLS
jgi:MFS family permease